MTRTKSAPSRTKTAAAKPVPPHIANPASGNGTTRLSRGKPQPAALPPPKIKGKRPPPPSNNEFEDEEPVPVPKPKKHRAIVSPSASPEPDVEHEFDFEPNGAHNTPETSPPPRRSDKGQARRDVELVEDDREEEEYGPGDPEGEGEGDDEDAPSAFQDPERAAENLIQALDGVKEKQRYLVQFKKAARIIPRTIQPFLTVGPSIEVGLRIDPTKKYEQQNLVGIKNMTKTLCYEIKCFYEKLTSICPDLIKAMHLFADDPETFDALCKYMDKCANAARQDDCSRIRHHVVLYIPLVSTTLEKDERGWHNQHTARHLCPQDMLTEFDADWLKFTNSIMTGDREINENDLPSFLWDQSALDPDDPFAGLCRGPLLVKCFRNVFTGPRTGKKDGPGLQPGKSCLMQKYNITQVSPDMLGYIAALVRFCLNAQSRWQQVDGDFDNAEFFANVRGLFFSDSEFAQQWAEETIEWWNMQVFFTKPAESRKDVEKSMMGKLQAHIRRHEELQDVE